MADEYEWATTSSELTDGSDPAPDPAPPPGDGWRLRGGSNYIDRGVRHFWYWERRKVPKEETVPGTDIPVSQVDYRVSSAQEIIDRSALPPEDPRHICGISCDGQDGKNSWCANRKLRAAALAAGLVPSDAEAALRARLRATIARLERVEVERTAALDELRQLRLSGAVPDFQEEMVSLNPLRS